MPRTNPILSNEEALQKQQVEYAAKINEIITQMIENRDLIIKNVFKNKSEKIISYQFD